jgi:hypothetical protein
MSLTEGHPYLLPPKSPPSPENGPLPPKKNLQTQISLPQSEEIPHRRIFDRRSQAPNRAISSASKPSNLKIIILSSVHQQTFNHTQQHQ